MTRTKHKCADFESVFKIDDTGKLKCPCGLEQPIITVSGEGVFTPIDVPRPSALTDDHPAGKADTSREAFAKHNRGRTIDTVTNLIRASNNGLTAEEAADAMGVGQATTSARFNDLKRAGMIEKTVRRNTRSGRAAWAWRLKRGV